MLYTLLLLTALVSSPGLASTPGLSDTGPSTGESDSTGLSTSRLPSSELSSPTGEVWLIDIDGPIGPATADHVVRNLDEINLSGAEALILRMDTPGGLDSSMRDIIHAILASRIPVIGYVAPQGSRAASAGTYILYASHIAAMAPATNLGAATPVQLGGTPSLPTPGGEKPADTGDGNGPDDQQPVDSGNAMHHKVVNDARAYIRSLAELRGRNAEWAVKAVTEAATLSADQALEQKVIDLVADDEASLLRAVSGRKIMIAGQERTLNTAGAIIRRIEPDWRTEFLGVITNPNIAYILLLIGVYGLIFELSSPGMGAGGIIGGICLLLALYALQVLPISYSALGLLFLGLGLMVAEAMSPSFGILGLGGIVAFIVGSIMLLDTDVPGFRIALPIILALALTSAGLLILVVSLLLKSRRRAVVSGLSTLEGRTAEVMRVSKGSAMVRLQGELWRVQCDSPLSIGDRVLVTGANGLVLKVKKEN